jgi:hypothetical protein
MIERMSLPVDLVAEIERRAVAEDLDPEELASRLVVEELPKLVADLLVATLGDLVDRHKRLHQPELGSERSLAPGTAP